MEKAAQRKRLLWQLPLTVAFLIFGMLLAAQYYTHSEGASLEHESTANLAMLIKSGNDNKQALETELASLQRELAETQQLVDGGESIFATMSSRIANLRIATGAIAVSGSGLSISINSNANLLYYDLIDLVNELFISGAEAVSINDIRFTSHTRLDEAARINTTYDQASRTTGSVTSYVLTVDGRELLYPIVIKAIGDPATLAKGLDYPGGIIENLNTLYGVHPQVKEEEAITIPAVKM